VTEPVWNGRGEDPWLPQRLDARLEVGTAERDIRQAVWAELSGWLVETARAVLRGGQRPNPDAVWSRVPAWREAVDLIVSGEIRKAFAAGFRRIFGDAFRWDQRVRAVTYLAEVTNRLVRVPDEVFDLVAHEVATGVNLGEGIPELRARIDTVLSTTGSERWSNRATVIARTEAIGALNAGRAEAFRAVAEEDPDQELERVWLATDDHRTRNTHQEADGQRVPLGQPFLVGGFELAFPGDPNGPPQEVIQCVPGDTVVQYPGLRNALRRRYQGQMVRIELATGDNLTITPNHPVLRADGVWTPAGELQEGDQLLSARLGGHTVREPYPGHVPAQIGQVYRTSRLVKMTDRVTLSPKDLHGDAPHGQIEVVPVDRNLGAHLDPATDEEVHQLGLALAHLAGTGSGCTDHPIPVGGGLDFRDLDRGEHGHGSLQPTREVGGGGQGAPGLGAELSHTDPVGLTTSPDLQAQALQFADDSRSAGSQLPGHLEDALPTSVTLAEVVRIERYTFNGHVFNLDTGHGWYIANSIITRNCRCTMLLVEPGEIVDMSNRQYRSRR